LDLRQALNPGTFPLRGFLPRRFSDAGPGLSP
jgi:hypothetical protein